MHDVAQGTKHKTGGWVVGQRRAIIMIMRQFCENVKMLMTARRESSGPRNFALASSSFFIAVELLFVPPTFSVRGFSQATLKHSTTTVVCWTTRPWRLDRTMTPWTEQNR